MTMDGLNEHFAKTRNSVDEVKARRLMERVRFLSKEVFVGGKIVEINFKILLASI